MTRGQKSNDGETRTAPNGYHYTKVKGAWRLTHHIIMEKTLGRPIADNELVTFKDGNRKNLVASNIVIKEKGKANLRRRRAQLEDRIRELQAELASVNQELNDT